MTTECRLGLVPIAEIDPGNRARKDYKDIAALASDIKNRGLIHPIAVMKNSESGYLLLAGGRRLVACKSIELSEIECKIFPPTLSELEILSIELMENILREDLTYIEEVQLERKILQLQETIYGKKVSTAPDAPGVSMTDVASMIGVSREKLRRDIDLAKTIEQFPDLGWEALKNHTEAMKIKENIGKLVIRQEAVKRFNAEVGSPTTSGDAQKRYLKRLSDSYVTGDFFEFVKQIPDRSFNLIEIDPPYAIKLEKLKKKDGSGKYSYGEEGYNEILSDDYADFLLSTFEECYRVLADDGFLLCWFGPEPWFSPVLNWLRQTKFTVRGMPCIWVKGDEAGEQTSGQTNTPMRHLANAYEMFFYAKKGDPRINRQGMTNVFGHKPVPATQKIHPTERPKELMIDILTTFAPEGSRVLVPFAGSGNTILAAYENKMTAVGTDLGVIHKESYIERLLTTLMQ